MSVEAIRASADELFEAITRRDVDTVLNKYTNDPDLYVHLEGPRWTNRGYENIKPGWLGFFESDLHMTKIEWVEGPLVKVDTTLGYLAGVVEIAYTVKERSDTIRYRGTYIMRKDDDGTWRIFHEHFSQPLQDPYGLGDWLKKE